MGAAGNTLTHTSATSAYARSMAPMSARPTYHVHPRHHPTSSTASARSSAVATPKSAPKKLPYETSVRNTRSP